MIRRSLGQLVCYMFLFTYLCMSDCLCIRIERAQKLARIRPIHVVGEGTIANIFIQLHVIIKPKFATTVCGCVNEWLQNIII